MTVRPHIEIIAEAGVNHDGSLTKALELVTLAHEVGADAVKFQTFVADALAVDGARLAKYQEAAISAPDQKEMLRRLELDRSAFHKIAAHAVRLGIRFLSTPFDAESLRFLVADLGMAAVKLSSGDLTNGPLLLAAAQTQRPLILSTGMANETEIAEALGVVAFAHGRATARPSRKAFAAAWEDPVLQDAVRAQVTLLQCTSQYPAPVDQVNLKAMGSLATRFGTRVGFSDHSEGIALPIAAAALGATMIEKHFTLDRSAAGPDHRASLNPSQFAAMVQGVRDVEAALGDGIKRPQPCESEIRLVARRSLVTGGPVRKDEAFTEANVVAKRPANGRSPFDYWDVLGTKASRDLADEELIP